MRSSRSATPACRNCARKKVRCNMAPGSTEPCERCVRDGIHCELPDPNAIQSLAGAQRKRACDACTKNKIRCERTNNPGDVACRACIEKNVACTFAVAMSAGVGGPYDPIGAAYYGYDMQRPSVQIPDGAHHSSSSTSPAHTATPSTGPNSPSRSWKDICLAPSP